jgi:hypothetical protein
VYFSVHRRLAHSQPVIRPLCQAPCTSLGDNLIYRLRMARRKIAFDGRDTVGNISQSFWKALHNERRVSSELQPLWWGWPEVLVIDGLLVGKLPRSVTVQYI